MSCSRMYNDYDGVQHDYTRKQGLVWQQVFLPTMAPSEWAEREKLWNAVEEAEKTKDSRLAREFVVALPIELGRDEWISRLTDFIQDNFVTDGMCADVTIHDTDGHNPHAHIMVTVRPLKENGAWQQKTEKEYLCIRDGEEQGFTASEFKTAQTEGWEKQYQYKVEKKKVYMTPSAAEAQGLERVSKELCENNSYISALESGSITALPLKKRLNNFYTIPKYPKSTKYGRQNPVTARWNSEEQLVLWRTVWADTVNRCLERCGHEERIDHHSHAECGLDEQPTVHEGVAARAMERQGIVADRCELNRQIKADNVLLRELKSAVKKLMNAVKNTIPAIAEAIETVRQKLIAFRYHLLHIKSGKSQIANTLQVVKPDIKRYEDVVKQLKVGIRERRALLEEEKALSVIHVLQHRELARKIATLTEDIEELKSEKTLLCNQFHCADDHAMTQVRQRVTSMEASLKKLEQDEKKYASEFDAALKQYAELKRQAADVNQAELESDHQVIRPGKEHETLQHLQTAYQKKFYSRLLIQSQKEVSDLLDEVAEPMSVRERLQHYSK